MDHYMFNMVELASPYSIESMGKADRVASFRRLVAHCIASALVLRGYACCLPHGIDHRGHVLVRRLLFTWFTMCRHPFLQIFSS